MDCGKNPMIPVALTAYLSRVSGYADVTTFGPVPIGANAVAMAATVHAITGGGTLTLQLQGSYDGRVWKDVGSTVAFTTFGWKSGSNTSVAYSFVRIKAVITGAGTDEEVIFDLFLATSCQ